MKVPKQIGKIIFNINLFLFIILALFILCVFYYFLELNDSSYKEKTTVSGGSINMGGIFDEDTDTGGNGDDGYKNESDDVSEEDNVLAVLEAFIKEITVDSIVDNKHGGYAYAIELDDKIEKLFEKFPRVHDKILSYIDKEELDKNKNIDEQKKEKAKEIIKKFIKAEIIGLYPDLRSYNEISKDKELRVDELQGGIKIVRKDHSKGGNNSYDEAKMKYNISSDDQILTYIPYSEFTSKIASGDEGVMKHFSLKSTGGESRNVDIVVAGRTTITKKGNTKTVSTTHTTVSRTPGGSYSYTTGPTTTNQEHDTIVTHTYHEISINYQDSLKKYYMPVGLLWPLLVSGKNVTFVEKLADLAIDNTEIIIEAQDNITTTVDTDIEKYTTITTSSSSSSSTKENEDGTKTTITTHRTSTTTNNVTITKITETECTNTKLNLVFAETWVATYMKSYKNTQINQQVDEEWLSNPEWTTLDTDEDKTDHFITNNSQTLEFNEYTTAGSKVQYRHDIDKEHNFITYLNENDRTKEYINGTTSWLFYSLEKNPKTVDMIDLLKYLFYEATNINYGVTSYDFLEYDFDNFNSSSLKGKERFVRYIQTDSNWASIEYNYQTGGTIGKGGCGACALAMAVSGLNGIAETPDKIVKYLNIKGIDTVNGGGAACAEAVAYEYDLDYTRIGITYGEVVDSNGEKAKKINDALDAGKCLVFSVGYNGIYKGDGHYILCYGRDENGYYILDSSPREYYTPDKPYEFGEVFNNLHQGIFVLGNKK